MKGIKLIQAHNVNCGMFNGLNNGGGVWCLPKLEHLDLRRDKSKPSRGFSSDKAHVTFQCSDPGCDAKLAITWLESENRLSLAQPELRNIGSVMAKRFWKRIAKEEEEKPRSGHLPAVTES